MISEVVMPQMGADMKEGTVLRWLREEGDQVERGDVIAEIETDKANIEIEAFESGIFRKILVPEGETVDVGTVIAVIAGPEDDISSYEGGGPRATEAEPASPDQEPHPSTAAPEPAPEGAAARPPEPEPQRQPARAAAEAPPTPARGDGRVRASPVARRLADELGVDLSAVSGSGPEGRILRKDVEATRAGARPAAAVAAPPRPEARRRPAEPAAPPTTAPLSRMRQTIARRMQQSKQQAPHYYLTLDADMTAAMQFRSEANAALADTGRISVNDIIILATTRALEKHPRFNSWWVDDQLQVHSRVNMGIAIALEEGLIAPAILDVGSKPLTQISREARDLAERARGGSLRQEEYTGGTFTITNLGAYGVDSLIGIINPPQTAILGLGAVRERPVARDGQVVVRQMLTLALAADHRATDGAEGARFLQTLQEYLEKPSLMFI
jgi:pyruvate dehydrogenase E2 component (dihydrolipoamide acetyltransferase)